MTYKVKIALAFVVFLSTFAFGRFSAPEKVRIETKTVEVEKTKTNTDHDKHKSTTVTEVVKPDGTRTMVTQTTEDDKTNRKTISTNDTTTDKVKEVTKSGMHLTIDVITGVDLFHSNPNIVYGLSFGANVLGPIRVGAFGLSTGVSGVSVGLYF